MFEVSQAVNLCLFTIFESFRPKAVKDVFENNLRGVYAVLGYKDFDFAVIRSDLHQFLAPFIEEVHSWAIEI